MQEKSQSYRISRLKNNFTKTDEEPFLKTINSSSTKKLFNNSRIASFNKDDLSRKVTFNSSNKYFKQKLPSQKNIV